MRRHHILLLVVAMIAVLPLFVYGCSCGHDFDFHIQSWLEAKRQLLHGTIRPHWVFSAAFNAGEPRFVFYPPLSWVLGELLALFVPITQLPAVYTLVVIALAAQTMYLLAREFVSDNAAALSAALYIVNPYMLFTAYERTAFAELLAAAWMPLLLRAALKKRPTVLGIAIPLALLWLTNAPAAVIGSYTMAVLMAVRVVLAWRVGNRAVAKNHALVAMAGAALGLALTAFYLLPAAYERRFVQIAMATIVNMRVQDNFLFGHTGDGPHDAVLHTASQIAVALLCATALLLAAWYARRKEATLTERGSISPRSFAGILAMLIIAIAFLLTPVSRLLWEHVPELSFLQFPWRLLIVAAVVCALSAGLLASSARIGFGAAALLALIVATALTTFGSREFRQGCEAGDYPAAIAKALETHQGLPPTDEYTPVGADNDALQNIDSPYWFGADARTAKPLSTANGERLPPRSAELESVPAAFDFNAGRNDFLILNLRDYPNWRVVVDEPGSPNGLLLPHSPRADGRMALRLPHAGSGYRGHIDWQTTPDERAGSALSVAAGGVTLLLLWRGRSRRINT